MNIWLVMLLAGALTFGMRFSFIYLFGRFEIPAAVKRALRFVPPAVLSAIIAPALFMPNSTLDLSWSNYRLIAGAVAILVAWRTKNTLITILAGMIAFWCCKLFLSNPTRPSVTLPKFQKNLGRDGEGLTILAGMIALLILQVVFH